MEISKKLIVSIILLASFINAYGVRITNKGTQTITVKIDAYVDLSDIYISTQTVANLKPGQTVEREIRGKYIYILQGLGKASLIPITNGITTGENYGKFILPPRTDIIEFNSQPDPKNSKNLQWSITTK